MTIEKCKDFIKDGYGTWDDTSKPTTFANMHDFMKNQNNIVMNLVSGIWQPSTSYTVGTTYPLVAHFFAFSTSAAPPPPCSTNNPG